MGRWAKLHAWLGGDSVRGGLALIMIVMTIGTGSGSVSWWDWN